MKKHTLTLGLVLVCCLGLLPQMMRHDAVAADNPPVQPLQIFISGPEVISVNDSATYSASGGSGGGYTFSSPSDKVTVDPNTGEVTAGANPSDSEDDVELDVSDSDNNTASTTITVVHIQIGGQDSDNQNQVVDRDDPTQAWDNSQNLNNGDTIYSGDTTGDFVSWQINITPDVSDKIVDYSWSADGQESQSGPDGENEDTWDIGDTDSGGIDWQPGDYNINCSVSFDDGSEVDADDYTQTLGYRSKNVVVVGWIDAEAVKLNTANVDNDVLAFFPDGGSFGGNVAQEALTSAYIGLISTGVTSRPVAVGFARSSQDNHYILNWLFTFAANPQPPNSFDSDDDLQNFVNTPTNYKLLNQFQIKCTVNGSAMNDDWTVVNGYSATDIGATVVPTFTSYSVDGEAGPNNGVTQLDNGGVDVYQINDGDPDAGGVLTLNTLMSPLKWSDIGSNISHSIFSYTITNQVYPTYFIYEQQPDASYILVNTIDQADDPSANFSSDPYPPGSAPFVPDVL